MKQPTVDPHLTTHLARLAGGRFTVLDDRAQPTVSGGGVTRRLITRRITDLSQFQVESAILHAAVNDRISDASPSFLLLAAQAPLKNAGQRIIDLLTAAGCGDYRFAVLTPHGPHLLRWDGPGEEIHDDEPQAGYAAPTMRGLSFAPAQSWVVRALLLGTVRSHEWWQGPRPAGAAWASASELAQAGDLAVSTVARTLQALEQRSWIDKGRAGFRLLDPAAMIQAFADDAVRRWGRRQPMRLAYGKPGGSVIDAIGRAARDAHIDKRLWAESGWGALARARVAVTSPGDRVPEVLLVGTGAAVWTACPMVPAPLREAHVVVHLGGLPADIPAPSPEQAPVVDPLLAMRHVAGDPQGGQEQVARLRVLLCEAHG